MNTTRKQKHLAACLRGGDHRRSETKAPTLALRRTRQLPFKENCRTKETAQTLRDKLQVPAIRGSYTSPNGAAKGRRKLRVARLTCERDSGPECSKPSAGPQNRENEE
jgi:hypothetical protein